VERSGQVTALAGDIIRSKALDLLVEAADVTHTDAPAVSERDLDVVEFDLEASLEQGE
jgi:hypothetical protein